MTMPDALQDAAATNYAQFRDEISVIIPTYNRSASIIKTLESVFRQTFAVREIILVDDGSSDDTSGVVEEWLRCNPDQRKRLCYLHQPNQGKSAALNLGLARVSGKWIAFNDSDDTWHPHKIEEQVTVLSRHPTADACFTDARFVNNPEMAFTSLEMVRHLLPGETGLVTDGLKFFLTGGSRLYMQTVLLSKAKMDEIGPFDIRFRISQDADFLFQMARICTLCYTNSPLVEIDRTVGRKEGLTTEFHRKTLKRLEVLGDIFLKWRHQVRDERPWVIQRVDEMIRGNQSAQANALLQSGQGTAAKERLRKELQRCFSLKLLLKWAMVWVSPALSARFFR